MNKKDDRGDAAAERAATVIYLTILATVLMIPWFGFLPLLLALGTVFLIGLLGQLRRNDDDK